MWEREEEYKAELEQVIQKAGTSRLERLAYLALEDERTCYKHVMVLLEKQYRKCVPNMRGKLHLLYCISTILRQSRKQQGTRDRYAERLQPLASALVVDLRLEFSAQVDKLLKLWRMEGVFSAEQFLEVESGRAAVALRQPGLQSKSPSGSLTEASAQDPHVGFGDASGSGRSSVIQSYSRFNGGRQQAATPGSVPLYQHQQPLESQDPYSADSNPNGGRTAPLPPPALPPPPPLPLIPPGLLGPVGAPGMLTQGSAAAAAAAAAAVGLFPQGQLGGFLGTAPVTLMQQGAFIAPLGPFGSGGMGNGMQGAIAGGVAPGMGGVLAGGMAGGLPFQGASGAIQLGLGLQRPPLYPQPPVYPCHSQGQNQNGRGLNRFSQVNGRTPPGLGPSSGLGSGNSHGQIHSWQGRFGHEGQSAVSQPLPPPPPPPPPPPRPPPGSPPHAAESRANSIGTTTAVSATSTTTAQAASVPVVHGFLRVNGGIDTHGVKMPPGLGPVIHACPDTTAGTFHSIRPAPTGYVRPSGRRSRWELERDTGDVEASAMAGKDATGSLPGVGRVAKRPALEVGVCSSASVQHDALQQTEMTLPRSTTPPPAPGAAPTGAGPSAAFRLATETGGIPYEQRQHVQVQPEMLEPYPQKPQTHSREDAASVPMDSSVADGQASGPGVGVEDVAVADGKTDPDVTPDPDERIVPHSVGITVVKHDEAEVLMVAPGKLVADTVEVVAQPEGLDVPAEAVELDDGSSSSAEASCPATQHQDSTAPASPGRFSGAVDQGESCDPRGTGGSDVRLHEQHRLEQTHQEQRRSSSSGAGESGYDGISPVAPSSRIAATDQEHREVLQQEQVAETAKAVETGMSTNRPSSVEQSDAQQRAHHDVQSAEQQLSQLLVEVADHHPPVGQLVEQGGGGYEAQPPPAVAPSMCANVGRDEDQAELEGPTGQSPETPGGEECAACTNAKVAQATVAAAQDVVADGPDEAVTSERPQAHAAESNGPAWPHDVAAATAAPASDAADAVAAPGLVSPAREAAAPAAAHMSSASPPAVQEAGQAQPGMLPICAQPPQQVALHSTTTSLLMSTYGDSRIPLKLEELELGDLDESWLE